MKPHKYQLKNGLTVLLAESGKSPVLSVQMWVRTGSADESPAQAGISHFIEHLVFKGTRKFGVGEIASTVEGAGGELNAYTSFDQTVFHVTIASSQADRALEVISEMMGHPLFDPEEVDKEREVVIEEIKRGQDSPGRRSSQLLFGTAFRKHPYGRPVIGFDRIIKKVSVGVLKKYFQDRYCPRNMFLLVTGDFQKPEMKKQIQKHFGDFADFPVRKVKRPKEPAGKSIAKIEKAEFKETYANFSWRIPNVKHPDVPALDALALILGQGDSSRFTRRLRIEEALVHSVGASAFTPIDEGLFSISLSLDPERASVALTALAEELRRFLAGGPSPEELSKAVVGLASDTIYSLETVDGLSRFYGGMEFYLRDPMAMTDYIRKLSDLKPVDLVRVAKKYLKPDKLIMTGLTEKNPAALKKEMAAFKKKYFHAAPAKDLARIKGKVKGPKAVPPGKSVASPIEKVALPGGGVLLMKHQPETPTTSFRLVFGGGMAVEPNGKEGLNELLTRAWSAGGHHFDEQSINMEVDSIAAGFGTFSGRNTIGLSADFISDFDGRMWSLIEDCVRDPSLPAEVFERERDLLMRQIPLRKDHPSHVCMRLFTEALFKGHPYAKDPSGTEDSLPKLTIDDVKGLASKVRVRGNVGAVLVGKFDRDRWMERLQKLTEALPAGNSQLKEVPHPGPSADIRLSQTMQKEQTHLVIGMKGLSLTDPRRWTLQVMQAVLAGQGGRLFIELRDKKSLAYSVSPLRMEGVGTGSFGAYIGCSPEKAELAERMILEEFRKLAETPVGEEELRRARTYLSGRTVIELQRKSAIAGSILFDEIYGNPPEEGLHPERRYLEVTAGDVLALAQDLFSRPKVTVAVGPKEV